MSIPNHVVLRSAQDETRAAAFHILLFEENATKGLNPQEHRIRIPIGTRAYQLIPVTQTQVWQALAANNVTQAKKSQSREHEQLLQIAKIMFECVVQSLKHVAGVCPAAWGFQSELAHAAINEIPTLHDYLCRCTP